MLGVVWSVMCAAAAHLQEGAPFIVVSTIFLRTDYCDRSADIRSVFATIDELQGAEPGATAERFLQHITLECSVEGEACANTFPLPKDMAHTMVFLGSDDSVAFNSHDFEVTHGMRLREESRST